MGRKTIKRGPGKRHIDGKDFHLADEIRYIQRRAAEHDGRWVTIGSLTLFSTDTGDAWLLDAEDHLAARLARDAIRKTFTSRKPISGSLSDGKANTELTAMPSFTSTKIPGVSSPSSATQSAESQNWVDRKISNMFG